LTVGARRLCSGAVVLALVTSGAAALAQARDPAAHRRPASTRRQPRPSLFGVDTSSYDSHKGGFFRNLPAAQALGVRWIRWTLGPKSAVGDYAAAGYLVNQARKRGMGIMLSFAGIPEACSERPVPHNVRDCPPTTPRDRRRYEAYVRRVLVHFRGEVTYYESWRNPNLKGSWAPRPSAAEYAALLRADYATFQSVNHRFHLDLKLLFGSPDNFGLLPQHHGSLAVLPYTHNVLADLHRVKAFNGIALHAYRFPPGKFGPFVHGYDRVDNVPIPPHARGPFPAEGCDRTPVCHMTWAGELRAYEQEFKDHGYGTPPLWLTEFGWPGNSIPDGNYYPSTAVQARDLKEAYAVLFHLHFVQAAFWFNVRNYQPGIKTGEPKWFYHYGLLEYNFTRKPAGAAYAALAKSHPGR
jgi:hypothetical protein